MTWTFKILISSTYFILYSSLALSYEPIFIYKDINSDPTVLENDWAIRNSKTLKAADPSFEKTAKSYYGIPLKNIFSFSLIKNDYDVTVIANDYYVVKTKKNEIKNAIIAYKVGNEQITPKFGGPNKLVFPNFLKLPGNAYNWYVKAIVLKDSNHPQLSIENLNSKIDLKSIPKSFFKEVKLKIPVPVGFRSIKWNQDKESLIKGIWVSDLILAINSSLSKKVIFDNLLTRQKEYTKEDFSKLFLVVSKDEKPIPTHEGGPFILSKSENSYRTTLINQNTFFFVKKIKFTE